MKAASTMSAGFADGTMGDVWRQSMLIKIGLPPKMAEVFIKFNHAMTCPAAFEVESGHFPVLATHITQPSLLVVMVLRGARKRAAINFSGRVIPVPAGASKNITSG